MALTSTPRLQRTYQDQVWWCMVVQPGDGQMFHRVKMGQNMLFLTGFPFGLPDVGS